MIIVFNIIFIALIAFIVWWFWLYKPSKTDVVNKGSVIDIIVDNGVYSPASIETKVGKPLQLRFTRKSASPCSSTVLFADFNQSLELALDKPVMITVSPDKAGTYAFTCEMGMYRGSITAV